MANYKIKGKLTKEAKDFLNAKSDEQTIAYDGAIYISKPDEWVMGETDLFEFFVMNHVGDTPIGPVGQQTYEYEEHLESELSTFFILKEYVFKEGAEITGEYPEASEVPDGAII